MILPEKPHQTLITSRRLSLLYTLAGKHVKGPWQQSHTPTYAVIGRGWLHSMSYTMHPDPWCCAPALAPACKA